MVFTSRTPLWLLPVQVGDLSNFMNLTIVSTAYMRSGAPKWASRLDESSILLSESSFSHHAACFVHFGRGQFRTTPATPNHTKSSFWDPWGLWICQTAMSCHFESNISHKMISSLIISITIIINHTLWLEIWHWNTHKSTLPLFRNLFSNKFSNGMGIMGG